MSEAKLKIEGAKKFRRPMRAAGQPTKKEFVTKVLGLESHTFDIGNAKYAAKYKKTVNAVANYIQREYKGGAEIEKGFVATELVAQGVRPEDVDSASGYNHQSRRSRPRVLPLVHVAPWSRQARSEE
jgi:hypothetical protein